MSDSDSEEEILPKTNRCPRVVIIHDCYVCYEKTTSLVKFSCEHAMCPDCTEQLRSLSCPFCRKELTMKDLGMKTYLSVKHRALQDAEERDEEEFREFMEGEGANVNPDVHNFRNALYEIFCELFTM